MLLRSLKETVQGRPFMELNISELYFEFKSKGGTVRSVNDISKNKFVITFIIHLEAEVQVRLKRNHLSKPSFTCQIAPKRNGFVHFIQ